jgi:hypothetical protein
MRGEMAGWARQTLQSLLARQRRAVQEARSTLNRFTGGGFNLNMPGT